MKHFFRYWFANAMSNFNCLSLPCVVGSKPLKKFYSVFSFENVSDLLHNFIDDCWVELCVCRHFCSRYSFDTLSLVVSQVYFDREKCKMLITTRIRIQLALHLILFYSSSLFFWFWVYLFFYKKKILFILFDGIHNLSSISNNRNEIFHLLLLFRRVCSGI